MTLQDWLLILDHSINVRLINHNTSSNRVYSFTIGKAMAMMKIYGVLAFAFLLSGIWTATGNNIATYLKNMFNYVVETKFLCY